jgi:3-phenylpropionate/cinnamic acid dioxygenase small subunit
VTRAETRDAVAELFAEYASAIDCQEFERLTDLFTDDAVWQSELPPPLPSRTIEGRRAILEFLPGSRESGQTRHVLTNLRLLEADDESALAEVYLMFTVASATATSLRTTGTYRGQAVQEGGRWQFRSLTVALDSDYH